MADLQSWGDEWLAAFNAHDEARIAALSAEHGRIVAPGDVELDGRAAVTGYAMAWLSAFPDATVTATNQVTADPWVVQEFVFEGTHTATLQTPAGEIPPTGRRLTGRGAQVVRVENGGAVETQLYFDQVQVMTQLGLMPEPATA